MTDIFDPIACTESGHAGIDRWNDIVNATAPGYGVPPNLCKAIMLHESGGDPNIVSFDLGYGLMQITTGVKNGLYDGETILAPLTNVRVACSDFIAPLMTAFGTNLDAIVAGYNAGKRAVADALSIGRPMTAVTYGAWYVPAVTSSFDWLNQQSHKELGK